VFHSNLKGIAQIRDFYKLKELTLQDITFVRRFLVEPYEGEQRKINEDWIKFFNFIFEFKAELQAKGINSQEVEKVIGVAVNNFEEDYHGVIESTAIKYLDSIKRHDISFYCSDKGRLNFFYFLCAQYLRTNRMRESVLGSLTNNMVMGVNFNNVWNVMAHIFTTNMAFGLAEDNEKYRIVLLNNKSKIPLIAGDQPVINTYAIGKQGDSVNELEFYYPISPVLAILISGKDEYKFIKEKNISDDDAERYNLSIKDQSHSQIYASSENNIKRYV